ncbi:SDR family NAD(P)-dependent oxidoreductase [Thalassotalea sediminis]|uniref:SDR family NAD(P)-dependent oxidoreductase n=1 Tax=Thalassotalea sediminis TaxID=1759089 RepID=UPI00257469CE|nr:SDR family oxidoreductase [Thalassotalea sediminis]
MQRLKNKVALITGGSRGMGAAIAERLAQEGANVVITYVNNEEKAHGVVAKLRDIGAKAIAIKADNADPQAITSGVDATVAAFGQLDILVNNAGIFNPKPIEAVTLEDINQILNINVRAVVLASKAAAAYMKPGGRIISIGSNLAERAVMPGLSLYSLSKAALIGFTKGLARDLGQQGITVNIVHPGSTNTDMNPADGEYSDMQRNAMCIPQYAEPDDIAGVIAFIASEEGKCMTASELTIDGGANA